MHRIEHVLEMLQQSSFRRRFRLRRREQLYLEERGLECIMEHARGFVDQRLAPARPANDGRQTPMRGHPVFIAQHATATCCRSCLERWHNIMRNRPLHETEIEYVVQVIRYWLRSQSSKTQPTQPQLFEPSFDKG